MTINPASILAVFLGLSVLFSACKKDDPAPPDNGADDTPARFTTLQITFTDPESNNVFRMRYQDLDGEGGAPPQLEADALPAGLAFNAVVAVRDDSRSPSVDLTPGLLSQGTDHQFFFRVQDAALTVLYNDADANGAPIGQRSVVISGAAGQGSLEVLLLRAPDKGAEGVEQGDPAQAGGTELLRAILPLVIN